MKILSFNLAITTQAQVRKAIRIQAKFGFTGGIYLWINSLNGKFYVGSTLNFYNRISSYFYLTKMNGILLKAFEKYSLKGFTLALIAIPNASKELVLELEQHVLDTFSPEYKIQPCASSSVGRVMSEESKAKLAAFRKGLKLSKVGCSRKAKITSCFS